MTDYIKTLTTDTHSEPSWIFTALEAVEATETEPISWAAIHLEAGGLIENDLVIMRYSTFEILKNSRFC